MKAYLGTCYTLLIVCIIKANTKNYNYLMCTYDTHLFTKNMNK